MTEHFDEDIKPIGHVLAKMAEAVANEEFPRAIPVPCRIVGMNFRGAEAMAAVSHSVANEPLELELEDDNKYDPNAVRVRMTGIFVGYIPKTHAPLVRHWFPHFIRAYVTFGGSTNITLEFTCGDQATADALQNDFMN